MRAKCKLCEFGNFCTFLSPLFQQKQNLNIDGSIGWFWKIIKHTSVIRIRTYCNICFQSEPLRSAFEFLSKSSIWPPNSLLTRDKLFQSNERQINKISLKFTMTTQNSSETQKIIKRLNQRDSEHISPYVLILITGEEIEMNIDLDAFIQSAPRRHPFFPHREFTLYQSSKSPSQILYIFFFVWLR